LFLLGLSIEAFLFVLGLSLEAFLFLLGVNDDLEPSDVAFRFAKELFVPVRREDFSKHFLDPF